MKFADYFPDALPGTADAIRRILIPNAKLTNPRRLFWALAQLGHESLGFTRTVEKGQPAYFAKYDGNKKLGNEKPGDGVRFKGRGWIQVTGKWNWLRCADDLGWDDVDALLCWAETVEGATSVSSWYWTFRECNSACDMADFVMLTKKINGGLNGLADRQHLRYRMMDDSRALFLELIG